MARDALIDESNSMSVCIDNTNSKPEQRKVYLDIAKAAEVSQVRCFHFDIPKDKCLENNDLRKVSVPGSKPHISDHVPKIAIHTFFKNFKMPEKSEGFTQEPIRIEWVPNQN